MFFKCFNKMYKIKKHYKMNMKPKGGNNFENACHLLNIFDTIKFIRLTYYYNMD